MAEGLYTYILPPDLPFGARPALRVEHADTPVPTPAMSLKAPPSVLSRRRVSVKEWLRRK